MTRRGFTIVELIIVITIVGILLTLAVVSLNGTQAKARDDERRTDIQSIATTLESVYTGGVSSDGSLPTISNLVPNPSLKTDSTNWSVGGAGGSSDTTRVSTGGPPGISAFFRRTVTTALTSSPAATYPSGSGTSGIAVSPSQTYTFSVYVRTSFPLSSGFRIDITQYDAAGVSLGGSSGSTTSPITNTWIRLSRTFTTGASTAYVRPNIAFSGSTGAAPGQTFDGSGFQITSGSVLYDFNDGNSGGWSWTGTANNSISTGPAVAIASPGGYPSVVMLNSLPLLSGVLPDADQRIFLPPSVTDPMTGFVIATNSTQTTSGVSPQPTTSQYVYQPIDSRGLLCTDKADCRKFNLYYRLEEDNTVYKVTSKSQ
jgi:prepilin-type N-terminal cleavage/methylation domain-containing protein